MLKVLLVEDNLADARLLQKFLSKVEKEHFQLMSVECTSDAITCLHQNPFDVILLDLSLPDSQGLETVKQVYNAAPYVPIVVLTGLDDEYTATEALREGAQDYLLKDEIRPDSLVRAIHYAIERQQILDEVRQLNEKLIRSNKELEQFAYVVSHDLQQPLQNIISFAELLAYQYQGRLDKKADLYLNFIVKAGVKMGQLIKDLLAYSRIGMSNHPVEEPTDAHRVFQLVLNNLQIAIAESQAIITADPLPTVMINEIQLTQLLQNFITNAIKYHRPGIAPQIHISVKKQDPHTVWVELA